MDCHCSTGKTGYYGRILFVSHNPERNEALTEYTDHLLDVYKCSGD